MRRALAVVLFLVVYFGLMAVCVATADTKGCAVDGGDATTCHWTAPS